MTKVERRTETVPLYQGNYQSELAALLEQAMAAQRAEESAPRRHGTKSEAAALAKKYDDLQTEAESAAVKVVLYEISNIDWQKLADEHPPRPDDAGDKMRGVNMKTFPAALLQASLGRPAPVDLEQLSRLHYVKLETAAWNLHNGDDALPKFSLVSLLKQQRDPDSKPPSDSE